MVSIAQVLLIMTQFYSSIPADESVTVNLHAQYQEPETESAQWNSATFNLTVYTCDFSGVMCQNDFHHNSCSTSTLKENMAT